MSRYDGGAFEFYVHGGVFYVSDKPDISKQRGVDVSMSVSRVLPTGQWAINPEDVPKLVEALRPAFTRLAEDIALIL